MPSRSDATPQYEGLTRTISFVSGWSSNAVATCAAEIPRNDDLVARPNAGQHEGVVAGGRTVEQKEAAVGFPGVGGHRFRDAKGIAAEVGVADAPSQGDIAVEGVPTDRFTQLVVGADTEFVSGR